MTHHSHDPVTEPHEHGQEPAPAAPRGGEQVNVNTGGTARTYTRELSPLAYARRIIGLLFGILLALLAIRILLLALGANEGNALVDGMYGLTEPFVAPFRGVFSIDEVRPVGRSVIDVAAIVAVVGWSLIALLILAILRLPERA